MDVLDAIRDRRSIRRFDGRPIDDATLETILEAARWAPSWANTQCARYTIVTSPELKEGLVATFSERNPARPGALEAPCMLVLSAKKAVSGFKKGEPVTEKGECWYMFDVGLAAQNLTLAAFSLGLGTVHVGAFDATRAARLISLPEDEVIVELIPIGYPTKDAAAPPRKELTELVRRR